MGGTAIVVGGCGRSAKLAGSDDARGTRRTALVALFTPAEASRGASHGERVAGRPRGKLRAGENRSTCSPRKNRRINTESPRS